MTSYRYWVFGVSPVTQQKFVVSVKLVAASAPDAS